MRRAVVSLLGLALLLTGCAGRDPAGPAEGSRGGGAHHATGGATVTSYVAMGDSYTAAPYVPLTDVANGCLRSDHDYPALVGRSLHLRQVRDVSCGGATTRDLEHRQQTVPEEGVSVPPQLRAVRPDTDLVTVGIGGNDFGLFGLVMRSCSTGRPGCLPGSVLPRIRRDIAALRPRLVHVLDEVRRRAPDATVLLVGYPKIAPDHRGCARLPIGSASLSLLGRLNHTLNATMRAAARDADVGFVDVYAASAGHDICAEEPWVNGVRTDTSRAAALHPFPVEQRAVARMIVDRVSR